ncbi:hypothetical protein M911_06790 [Ectothiorhodospira haloalkaliphila]|uniref:Glycosyltransferase 2-like domain-containing protein n=1 Tax=Ectothiorhodospira haloalkaliphila TaxID=421628 RepID=W8KNE5_9GAMM|nr:glycosyltransferase family 2 protein [Ectothiorhodospira haloalkaliphila]AHK80653.1 hypothetical protein M911_06790 [Ectothiorhodospira haloalkaliphila]
MPTPTIHTERFQQIAELIQANDLDQAMSLLRESCANATTGGEALLWQAAQALKSHQAHTAWLLLCSANALLPSTPDIFLLLAKAARQQNAHALADQLLIKAQEKHPEDPSLNAAAWQARARQDSAHTLRRDILQYLPHVQHPHELKTLLALLPPSRIGAASLDTERGHITGWIFQPDQPQSAPMLVVEQNHKSTRLPADRPHPLLRGAGLSPTGGFRLQLPPGPHPIQLTLEDGTPLIGSPLVLPEPLPPHPPCPESLSPVHDIIVPVYRGEQATLACLHSVIDSRAHNRTPFEIHVLEDASPEPALVNALQALAQAGHIQLVQHPANLGFIRGMNRAMARHPDRHVVWLNADTRVQGNWLDRLHQAAHSAPNIASVTPLSNHGELMSFPQPAMSHPMPEPSAHRQLDELAQQAWNGDYPTLDVACGFCLYIRREALARTGYLDEIHLQGGYGEDTDWSLRARAQGLKHLGAPNIYVAHAGSLSFGPEKRWRVARHNALLRRRYPHAERSYQAHLASDPVKPHRERLQALLQPHDLGHSSPSAPEDSAVPASPHPIPQEATPSLLDGTALLIADTLNTPEIGQRWLHLARQLARHPGSPYLVLTADTPWQRLLQASSQVIYLQAPPGLSMSDTLTLAGCRAAVSLDTDPPTDWHAPTQARACGLPLFAPKSPRAREAGAQPLDLPINQEPCPA